MGLLAAAYLAGQGGLFVAQSIVIAGDGAARIADFGIAIYWASLAALVVDFGAPQYLAREAAKLAPGADFEDAFSSTFWSIVPIRIALLAVLAVPSVAFWSFLTPFVASYLSVAAFGLVFWVVNLNGVLDGVGQSGPNGAINTLPFLTQSIGLLLTSGDANPGAILGGCAAVSYAAVVILQHFMLRRAKAKIRLAMPKRTQIADTLLHSGSALLSTLPGQCYFRFQMQLASTYLGPEGAGLFIYAKQAVTAVVQFIGFIFRVQFPDMVRALSSQPKATVIDMLKLQWIPIGLGAIGTLGFAALAFPQISKTFGSFGEALAAIGAYSPVILSSVLVLAAGQGLMSLRRFRSVALNSAIGHGLAAAFASVLIAEFGLSGAMLSDLLAGGVIVMLAIWTLKAGRLRS